MVPTPLSKDIDWQAVLKGKTQWLVVYRKFISPPETSIGFRWNGVKKIFQADKEDFQYKLPRRVKENDLILIKTTIY
jgi:hypothetical protein